MYRDLHRANVISVGYGERERENLVHKEWLVQREILWTLLR